MQKKKKFDKNLTTDRLNERTTERIGSRKMNQKKKKNAYGIFISLSAFDWNSFLFSCWLTVARQWAAATHATLNSTKIVWTIFVNKWIAFYIAYLQIVCLYIWWLCVLW